MSSAAGTEEVLTLCKVSEVQPNTMRGVRIGDRDFLVINDGGTFRVYRNRCPHRGARLSAGKLEGGVLTCPWHHARFAAQTGTLLSGPEVGPAIPFLRKVIAAFVSGLQAHPVVLRGDAVCVGLRRAAS